MTLYLELRDAFQIQSTAVTQNLLCSNQNRVQLYEGHGRLHTILAFSMITHSQQSKKHIRRARRICLIRKYKTMRHSNLPINRLQGPQKRPRIAGFLPASSAFHTTRITADDARYFLFATDVQLNLLKSSNTWYVAAAFEVVSKPFAKLFRVSAFDKHAQSMKQVPPVVCAISLDSSRCRIIGRDQYGLSNY